MTAVHFAVAAFAALLPITNPIGAVAVFAGLTVGQPAAQVRRQALRTGVYVFVILATFTLVGSLVLHAFGITIPALQIAGGLVVAHSGFGMIIQRDKLTATEQTHASAAADVSFSPMALPLVAGPGAIGLVIALVARNPGLEQRVGVLLGSFALAVLIAVTLRFGTPLVDRLGPTGIGALGRVMGFLILAIGVELALNGVLAVAR